MNQSSQAKYYLEVLKPWELLMNVILFLMGAGLANYLDFGIQWESFWKGMGLMILIQLGGFSLDGVFIQLEAGYNIRKEIDNIVPGNPRTIGRIRLVSMLILTVSAFSIALIFLFSLAGGGQVSPQTYFLLILFLILLLFFSVPPIRLSQRGYGELILAITGALIYPAIGYSLQADEVQRILLLTSLPITLFYFAMEISRSLQPYASSPARFQGRNLIGRLGPDKSLKIIILLVFSGYLAAGVSVLFGLSWSILWRIMLSLPIGIILIWQIYRLQQGAKPNWSLINLSAIALAVFSAYFVTIGFWMR